MMHMWCTCACTLASSAWRDSFCKHGCWVEEKREMLECVLWSDTIWTRGWLRVLVLSSRASLILSPLQKNQYLQRSNRAGMEMQIRSSIADTHSCTAHYELVVNVGGEAARRLLTRRPCRFTLHNAELRQRTSLCASVFQIQTWLKSLFFVWKRNPNWFVTILSMEELSAGIYFQSCDWIFGWFWLISLKTSKRDVALRFMG